MSSQQQHQQHNQQLQQQQQQQQVQQNGPGSFSTNDVNCQQSLEQTLLLLRESQSIEYHVQSQVQKKLSEWGKLPEFNFSLTCILCDPNLCDQTTRSLCCLVLKNNVRRHYSSFPQDLKRFIKEQSLNLLRDPSPVIRTTVGILITTIASNGELYTWSELLPTLGQMLNASEIEIVETAFSTLQRICEDLAEVLSSDESSGPLDEMLPRFLEFFKHPNPIIRNYALTCVNQFVPLSSKSINNMINNYIEALFLLANDTDNEVKRNVCRSLVTLAESKPDTLAPHLHPVIQYMLARCKDDHPDVSLEACEFWVAVPEDKFWKDTLRTYLPQLIPWLMEKMRYSPEEIEELRAQFVDDYMVPDKDDDIKPRFHRSKQISGIPNNQADGDNNSNQDISDLEEADLADDECDDDDASYGSDIDCSDSAWSLRKCTAAALDNFSNTYGDEILPFVFQEVEKFVNAEDWVVKEAAVLAIGAVAIGSLDGIAPHLPTLIPYLVQRLQDQHAFVRSITCWTVSRYTSWIVKNPREGQLSQILNELLKCILDDNKRVQEAACSSFATIAESAGIELVPHLDQIVITLVKAFDKYQHKNLLNLYDAIGTLAETVGNCLNQQKYIVTLLPPIIDKWNKTNECDADLFPLFESLSNLAVALRDGFKPYAEAVFQRCVALVEKNLQQAAAHNIDPDNIDMPNKDYMIASLDLLSGLAEGLNEAITDLVCSSNVMDLTIQCMVDPLPEVRQSSFALLGDLLKSCYPQIRPHVAKFITPLAQNLNYEHLSVCNNATWAFGELAVKMGSDIRQYLSPYLQQLINNINHPNTNGALLDNTAITIGRLARACPHEMAPSLNTFIKPWCTAIRTIRDNDAKDSAFRGICELIKINPNGIVNEFYYFCDAIACYNEPQQDLKQTFFEIIHLFRNQVGDQSWQQFKRSFPIEIKEKLTNEYNF